MCGRFPVEKLIREKVRQGKKMLAVLIDPESFTSKEAIETARRAQELGASLLLVGGSTVVEQSHLDHITRSIVRSVTVPVILFPNNITGITRFADAILFMSLINSSSHYFTYGAQALGARVIHKYKLEALPTAYIVVGEHSSASLVGYANPIPESKPELVAMYALASWYLGMRFLYLEAGSGSSRPLGPTVVETARKYYPGIIFAGGGIRKEVDASKVAAAGADVIVIGNLVEMPDFEPTLKAISESLKKIKS